MNSARRLPLLVHFLPCSQAHKTAAGHTTALVSELSKRYRCICVVRDIDAVADGLRDVAEILSYEEYMAVLPALQQERHLYNLSGDVGSSSVLGCLMHAPGTVVLHDLTLHRAVANWVHSGEGEATMQKALRSLHGPHAAELLNGLSAGLYPESEVVAYELNCLRVLNDVASSIVISSQSGLLAVRASGYAGPVHVVPEPLEHPSAAHREKQRKAARSILNLTDETLLFASFVQDAQDAQIPEVLSALARLPMDVGDWRFVLAGASPDPLVDRTIRRFGLGSRVIVADQAQAVDFDRLLPAVDALINLNFPVTGDISGVVRCALSLGVPAVVSAHGWYAELPETACFHVRPVPDIASALRTAFLKILLDRPLLKKKSAAAAGYASESFSPDRIAAAYEVAIEEGYKEVRQAVAKPLRGEIILQPPIPLLLDPLERDDALRALLRAEYACVDGHPTRRFNFSNLDDFPVKGAKVNGSVQQAFAALEYDVPVAGKLFSTILTASNGLACGELLTIAVSCGFPEHSDKGPATIEGMFGPLRSLLEQMLSCGGFEVVRCYERPLIPKTVDSSYCRIIVATAQKETDGVPFPTKTGHRFLNFQSV